jgi:hypothetical protein
MAQHQLTITPNPSVIEAALQLYDEIVNQSTERFKSYSIPLSESKEFLEKLRIIRDSRKTAFPGIKFSDPNWDIILSSAIDFYNGKKTSIKAACLYSGVSATTTLRCLSELESAGILQRAPDPSDQRRFFIRLTDQTKQSLDAWLRNSVCTVGLINASKMGPNCMDIGS